MPKTKVKTAAWVKLSWDNFIQDHHAQAIYYIRHGKTQYQYFASDPDGFIRDITREVAAFCDEYIKDNFKYWTTSVAPDYLDYYIAAKTPKKLEVKSLVSI